jgi:hypothetical protein
MSKFVKIVVSLFLFLVTNLVAERKQLEPNNFYEIDLRYVQLRGNENYLPLARNMLNSTANTDASFLMQLQPTYAPAGKKQDIGLNSWVQLSFNNNLLIINEMRLYYAAQNDLFYVGKEWRSISGFTNQSFLHWNKELKSSSEVSIQAGRFYNQIGPGRHAQLLLGASIRPMDQLALTLIHSIAENLTARFFFQTSALDKIGSDKRFMSLHRLEVRGNKWYVALSEALTYTRNNQGADLVYLNPFIFYHLEQQNGPNLSGNTIGTLELGYKWNTTNVYAEVLIDDVQFDNEIKDDLEPNEIGGLLGYEYAGDSYYVSIEGVTLTNRTYKTPNPSEWFVHRNKPIGYELGSDVGRLNILARYYPKDNWHIDTQIDMIWQGEGELSKAWDTPWDDDSITMETGYSEPFPTGVVEELTEVSVEVLRHWDTERWISLGISYQNTKNLNHISDINDSGFNIYLGASWTLEYEAIFNQ